MTGVNQHEKQYELFGVEYIVPDHCLYLVSGLLSELCKSVTRKIYKIPAVVDKEVVDYLGLARRL